MTLTNEMMNTANEILNKYEGKTISNTLANKIKKETNATRVEIDKFFNKAYIIYNGWVVTITDTEDFGEEVGKVTILDIEGNEPEEIYTTERE